LAEVNTIEAIITDITKDMSEMVHSFGFTDTQYKNFEKLVQKYAETDGTIVNGELIKSKQRVSENGEVFTPRFIVHDMLNLDGVDKYSFDLDKTFLEPSCGNGNFLVQILLRKLTAVSEDNFDTDILRALCSIYGVDITADNIFESRERMLNIIQNKYLIHNKEMSQDMEKSVKFVLCRNIILGNTLTSERDTNNEVEYLNIVGKNIKDKYWEFLDNNKEEREYSVGQMRMSEWIFHGSMVTRVEVPFDEAKKDIPEIEYCQVRATKLYTLGDKSFFNDDEMLI
jgi:hypothetical protein